MSIDHAAGKWKKQDLNPGGLALPVTMPPASLYASPPLNCPLLGLSSDLLGLCFPLEAALNGQFSMIYLHKK